MARTQVPFADLYPKLVQQIICHKMDGPFIGKGQKEALDFHLAQQAPSDHPFDLLSLILFHPAPGDFDLPSTTNASTMSAVSIALLLNCLEDGDLNMRHTKELCAHTLFDSLGWELSRAAAAALPYLERLYSSGNPHMKVAIRSTVKFASYLGHPNDQSHPAGPASVQ